jgi:hypothetical protein
MALPMPEVMERSGVVVGVAPPLLAPRRLVVLVVLPVRVAWTPVSSMSFAWVSRRIGCEPAWLRRRWRLRRRRSLGRVRVDLTSALGRRVEDDRMGRQPSCLVAIQNRPFGPVLWDLRIFVLLDWSLAFLLFRRVVDGRFRRSLGRLVDFTESTSH